MNQEITNEILPLADYDCFSFFLQKRGALGARPLHYHHDEYELNLILNAAGGRRIVGDHIGHIEEMELVLVGTNLYHGWFDGTKKNKEIIEVSIRFSRNLFSKEFLQKNQLSFMRSMLEKSQQGVLFSQNAVRSVKERLVGLKDLRGFDSVLELMAILHSLSMSDGMKVLSSIGFHHLYTPSNSRRIVKAFEYMNTHYRELITLTDLAACTNMHEASFSRFMKKSTGKTFIDSLNEIRLGHATRLLIDTNQTIAEIAYGCGFNNISNFNRIFRNKKHCTPREFRAHFSGVRVYVEPE